LYCLLVFGPEAKTRVWLVVDGDTLYVDRNGNGDLTGAGKRVAMPPFHKSEHPCFEEDRKVEAGDITDGPRTHLGLEVTQMRVRRDFVARSEKEKEFKQFFDRFMRQTREGVIYDVELLVDLPARPGDGGHGLPRVRQVAYADWHGFLEFADRPQKAPVIHFGGPLAMYLNPDATLARGDSASELKTSVGTPGLGNGTFAISAYDRVPRDVHPVAEVAFPAAAAGAAPVVRKVVLEKRC
jgi:hypothetical protein